MHPWLPGWPALFWEHHSWPAKSSLPTPSQQQVVCTDSRLDMVVGDKSAIAIIELTVPFELCVDSTVAGKTERYSELLGTCRDAGYNANLLTLEVGSRCFIHTNSFDKLYQSFPATRAKQEMARTCLLQSFRVWCKRNWKEPATSHAATD